ncbi:MAG: histidine--tRNA ligase [Fervidicoccaceae archaeon]
MKPTPPRGFRDIPPEIAIPRLRVIERIGKVFELYGFSPMETPAVEFWETLAGKYGEEAEGMLIWRFEDPRSGREYGLRYDLTVPLARYVASHPELPLPFKRYQIAPVWRHEEPQHMRYREFLQADVDVVGSPHPEADAEVLGAVQHALHQLGLRDVAVRLNHRVVLDEFFKRELGLVDPKPVYRAIDKLDKLGREGVLNELRALGLSQSLVERVERLLDLREAGGGLDGLKPLVSTTAASRAIEDLELIIELAFDPDKIVIDPSLVRGLDYYTGPIMEFSVGRGPSIAGGGRYDELIGLFRGGESIPATGCSIGVDRVLDVLVERGLVDLGRRSCSVVLVVNVGSEHYEAAWKLARELRVRGVPTEVDLMRRDEDKQRKRASALRIPIVVFVGQRELERGVYAVYDRERGERLELNLDSLVNLARERASSNVPRKS